MSPVPVIAVRVGVRVSMGLPRFVHMFVAVIHNLVTAARL